jgi:hypothetical protein
MSRKWSRHQRRRSPRSAHLASQGVPRSRFPEPLWKRSKLRAALDQHNAPREQECTSVGRLAERFTDPGGIPLSTCHETTRARHRVRHVEPDNARQIAVLAGGHKEGRMGCQDELARSAAHLSKKPPLQGRMKVPRRLIKDRNEPGRFSERGAQQQCFPDPSADEIDGQVAAVVVNDGGYLQISRRFLALGRLRGGKCDCRTCGQSAS